MFLRIARNAYQKSWAPSHSVQLDPPSEIIPVYSDWVDMVNEGYDQDAALARRLETALRPLRIS